MEFDLRTAPPSKWPELIDAVALGDILGRSTRTAQRHLSTQTFGPPINIGGRLYVRRNDLLRHLELHRVPVRPGGAA